MVERNCWQGGVIKRTMPRAVQAFFHASLLQNWINNVAAIERDPN
jgi:hypothetical protein